MSVDEKRAMLRNFWYKKNCCVSNMHALPERLQKNIDLKRKYANEALLHRQYTMLAESIESKPVVENLNPSTSLQWISEIVQCLDFERQSLFYINTCEFSMSCDIGKLRDLIVYMGHFTSKLLTCMSGETLPINIIKINQDSIALDYVIRDVPLSEDTILKLRDYFCHGELCEIKYGDYWGVAFEPDYAFLNDELSMLGYLRRLAAFFGARIQLNYERAQGLGYTIHFSLLCDIACQYDIGNLQDEKNYLYIDGDFGAFATKWLNRLTLANFECLVSSKEAHRLGEKSVKEKYRPKLYADICISRKNLVQESENLFLYRHVVDLQLSCARKFSRVKCVKEKLPVVNTLIIAGKADHLLRLHLSGVEYCSKINENNDIRILIVEDTEVHAAYLQKALSSILPNVIFVHTLSVENALQILDVDNQFDLILLDYDFSGMSGADFMKSRQIKSQHIPVILQTGHMLTYLDKVDFSQFVMCLSKASFNIPEMVVNFLVHQDSLNQRIY